MHCGSNSASQRPDAEMLCCVQTGQHWHGTTGSGDERMVQLMRMLNRLMMKHPESRSRRLSWHTPTIVPVWPQVRSLRHCCSQQSAAGLCAEEAWQCAASCVAQQRESIICVYGPSPVVL